MAVDETLVSENIAEMSRTLAKVDDPTLVQGFLFSLFTPSEADEIAKELGLSLCKITRGSRELKKEASPFKRMLELAGYEVPEVRPRGKPKAKPE